MTETEQGKRDELIRHNGNLVRTARDLQVLVNAAVEAIDKVDEVGKSIHCAHSDEADEYVIPSQEMEALRSFSLLAKTWGSADEC